MLEYIHNFNLNTMGIENIPNNFEQEESEDTQAKEMLSTPEEIANIEAEASSILEETENLQTEFEEMRENGSFEEISEGVI